MKEYLPLKMRSKVTSILIPLSIISYNQCITDFQLKQQMFCTLQDHSLRPVDTRRYRKLALQNPNVLDSIPATIRGRGHVIDEDEIPQSPHGRRGPVYMYGH